MSQRSQELALDTAITCRGDTWSVGHWLVDKFLFNKIQIGLTIAGVTFVMPGKSVFYPSETAQLRAP